MKKMNLAQLSLTTDPEKDLLGRKHQPRVSAPNTGASIWLWRRALSGADLSVVLAYTNTNCQRAWTYDWAVGLTIPQLETIGRLKKIAAVHRAQLSPAPVSSTGRNVRNSFGHYLHEKHGLLSVERHEVYDRTGKGEETQSVIGDVLSRREAKEKELLSGQFWAAVCCHKHYAKTRGSSGASVHVQRCNSWVEAVKYADSYHVGRHGWSTVEARYAEGFCHHCGSVLPLEKTMCKECSDAWPRVSRHELRELEEI